MSIYDTENLMQKSALLLGTSSMFCDAPDLKQGITKAIKWLKENEPSHVRTATFYSKKNGNSWKTKLDYILGIDDVLQCDCYDPDTDEEFTCLVAVDWTDNPLQLETKRNRFVARQGMVKELDCQFALAICVTNQVKLKNDRETLKFMYNALTAICDKVISMTKSGKFAGSLELDMQYLLK